LLGFVALIAAYVLRGDSKGIDRSHHTYQITTFWLGMMYMLIGLAIIFTLGAIIRIPVLITPIAVLSALAWEIWLLIRHIKGLIAHSAGRSI
jgi:uncharacterized membrane protein